MADIPSSFINIISEKWVKPSSPTPPSSKYYKFSFIDAIYSDSPVPLAILYPKENFHGGEYSLSTAQLFQLLETSLSETLTYYYPFAGRFMDDNVTVDCNDAGVQLWEVQIQASMSEILDPSADYNARKIVFPRGMNCYDYKSSHVMMQLNYFSCGGICLGISMSHKLGDAQTLCNFLEDWSTIARGISRDNTLRLPVQPILCGASIFPPQPPCHSSSSSSENTSSDILVEKPTNITRRFVFSASSLSKLKNMVTVDSEIENPTKVEVVTALIFKSVIWASKRIPGSIYKPSSLMHMANLRSLKINLPFSERHMGNFTIIFCLNVTIEEKELEKLRLSKLVTELRKSKMEVQGTLKNTSFKENYQFIQQISSYWNKGVKKLLNKSIEMYKFTSWCKFPFYKVDFGFGKPIFTFTTNTIYENSIILMDTASGDGIEAYVTLNEEQMSIFEKDEDLLAFAASNPIICVPN